MTDGWDQATFAGAEAARLRRLARLSAQQRLAWLEDVLRDADRLGVLADVRRRRQEAALAAWRSSAG